MLTSFQRDPEAPQGECQLDLQQSPRRVYQPVFRSIVMRAYDTQCAVCSLRHSSLLDAAHIVEDKHELGIAAVRNGMALCKIHHAAHDNRILGVRPDEGTISGTLLRESWELSSVTVGATPQDPAMEKMRTGGRRAKSARLLVEHGVIPDGAKIDMLFERRVRPGTTKQILNWISEDPDRGDVRWVNDPIRPLTWAKAPGERWTSRR